MRFALLYLAVKPIILLPLSIREDPVNIMMLIGQHCID